MPQQRVWMDLFFPIFQCLNLKRNLESSIKKYKLDFVFLVTPETQESRVRELDQRSSGFLVCCFIFFYYREKCIRWMNRKNILKNFNQ